MSIVWVFVLVILIMVLVGDGPTLIVYTAEPGSRSADQLRLLATCQATENHNAIPREN